MRAVNSVSLNGNVWQIESEGCEALASYLKSAEARLTGDPDREEILADLEQAIADKLGRHLNPHKNVITAAEVALALQEMGPVETGGPTGAQSQTAPGSGSASAAQPPPAQDGAPPSDEGVSGPMRHLFQIREGAMLSGVCKGLAAYFGVDVTLVRVIFVAFCVITGGIGVAVYLVMMIVVPVAVTAEQMAAAHGKPFSAEALIGRPFGPQPAFDAGRHWRQQWRDQRRMWRDQRRQWRRQQRDGYAFAAPGMASLPPHVGGPLYPLLHAVMLIVFIAALVGAAAGRPVMGWDWSASVPNWVGVIAVCVIYGTLAKQVRIAQYYGHISAYSPGHAFVALIGSIVWLAILMCVGWYVLHHWPEVQDILQRALQAIQAAFDDGPSHRAFNT